jgi:TRAP-type C4-dicarboxylate transport system permease small subunit
MKTKVDRYVDWLASGLALVGAFGVVVMMLHVTVYVVSRHVLAAPIPATVEIVSSYYMVMVAFLPLAWAERRGDMITVTLFANVFSPGFQAFTAYLVAIITLLTYLLLTCTTWLIAAKEFQTGAYVISLNHAVPTWPGYFALPVGFAAASLVALHRVIMLLVVGVEPPAEKAMSSGSISA